MVSLHVVLKCLYNFTCIGPVSSLKPHYLYKWRLCPLHHSCDLNSALWSQRDMGIIPIGHPAGGSMPKDGGGKAVDQASLEQSMLLPWINTITGVKMERHVALLQAQCHTPLCDCYSPPVELYCYCLFRWWCIDDVTYSCEQSIPSKPIPPPLNGRLTQILTSISPGIVWIPERISGCLQVMWFECEYDVLS